MRTSWSLPVLALAAAVYANENIGRRTALVYGDIELTYTTPDHTVPLNAPTAGALEERDEAYGTISLTYSTPGTSSVPLNVATDTATASCLNKPSNLHTKSRTRAKSHIRTCGESGSTCSSSSSVPISSQQSSSASSSVTGTVPSQSGLVRSSKSSGSVASQYSASLTISASTSHISGTETVSSLVRSSSATSPSSGLLSSSSVRNASTGSGITSSATKSSTGGGSSSLVTASSSGRGSASTSTISSTRRPSLLTNSSSATISSKTSNSIGSSKSTRLSSASGTGVSSKLSSSTTGKTSSTSANGSSSKTSTKPVTSSSTLGTSASSKISSSNTTKSSSASGTTVTSTKVSSTGVPSKSTVKSSVVSSSVSSRSSVKSSSISSHLSSRATSTGTSKSSSASVSSSSKRSSSSATISASSSVGTSVKVSSSVRSSSVSSKTSIKSSVSSAIKPTSASNSLSSKAITSSASKSVTSKTRSSSASTSVSSKAPTSSAVKSTSVSSVTSSKTSTSSAAKSSSLASITSSKVSASSTVKSSQVTSNNSSKTSTSSAAKSSSSLSSVSIKAFTSSSLKSSTISTVVSSKSSSASSAKTSPASSTVSSKALSSAARSSTSSQITSSARSSAVSSNTASSSVSRSETGDSWPSYSLPPTTSSAVSSGISVKPSATSSKASSTSTYVCSTPTPDTAKCIPCEGQPGSDPAKWCGYTVHDNSYKVVPKTCKTVTYDFTITNTTIAPDGYDRIALLVNGQMPGPTIEANWGDTIVVNLHNKLQNNGTSIHFHGARQNYTNEMDGATSVTQCPLAPGESMTYTFVANNYGVSWYHSHFALQAYEGVFGPMIVHGPHAAPYDVDAGVLTLQDWSHATIMEMFDAAQTVGSFPEHGPRTLDTGLINGLNTFGKGGKHYVLSEKFVPKKSYLIRLVNTAIQATFKFYIDGHSFQVIAADYVPIKPYTTKILNLNPGQRYEIIVIADQAPGSYWMRADSQDSCSSITQSKDIKAVINYQGHAGTPTSKAYAYTDECVDEPYASLVPVLALNAGAQDESISKTAVIGAGPDTPTLYKWTLDGSTFVSKWDDPTLLDLVDNHTITDYTGPLQLQYPKLGEWVYLVIQSPIPLVHPIHLHGHDFFVVGSGVGFYTGQPLQTIAPPRRDTALMPSANGQGGYLVVAWQADNPGAWLAHCHIGWHAAMGFTIEVVQGTIDTIDKTVTNSCQLDATCKAWSKYAASSKVTDLGI